MIVDRTYRTAWFQSQAGVSLTPAANAFLDQLQPGVERACWAVIGYSPERQTLTEFYPVAGGERPPLSYGVDIGWDLVGGTAVPRGRTDLYEGAITLKALPVRSVTSVYENLAAWTTGAADGNWPAATILPAAAYRLDVDSPGLSTSGRLYRVVGGWPAATRTLKITYVAGYTQAEIDALVPELKMAVCQGLAWWGRRAKLASQGTRQMGLMAMQLSIRDFSVQFGDPNMLGMPPGEWAAQILGPDSMAVLAGFVNMAKYLGG